MLCEENPMIDVSPIYATIQTKMDPAMAHATLEGYIEGWRSGDLEPWLDLFAEDAVFEDPAGSPPMEGKQAIAAFFDASVKASTGMNPVIERIVVCGNEAILLFTMNLYHPDGSGTALRVVDHFRLNDEGRIVRLRAFWDPACASEAPPL
jgi:steroid delta-isomerase